MLNKLGIDEKTMRILELNATDLRYSPDNPLRFQDAFFVALAKFSGVATASPHAADAADAGQFWRAVREQLSFLFETDCMLVLRGGYKSQPAGQRAGNPADRRSAVPLFVHSVWHAYADATRAGREAEVATMVIECSDIPSIQGTWIDGDSFAHAVVAL